MLSNSLVYKVATRPGQLPEETLKMAGRLMRSPFQLLIGLWEGSSADSLLIIGCRHWARPFVSACPICQ